MAIIGTNNFSTSPANSSHTTTKIKSHDSHMQEFISVRVCIQVLVFRECIKSHDSDVHELIYIENVGTSPSR